MINKSFDSSSLVHFLTQLQDSFFENGQGYIFKVQKRFENMCVSLDFVHVPMRQCLVVSVPEKYIVILLSIAPLITETHQSLAYRAFPEHTYTPALFALKSILLKFFSLVSKVNFIYRFAKHRLSRFTSYLDFEHQCYHRLPAMLQNVPSKIVLFLSIFSWPFPHYHASMRARLLRPGPAFIRINMNLCR